MKATLLVVLLLLASNTFMTVAVSFRVPTTAATRALGAPVRLTSFMPTPAMTLLVLAVVV